MKMFLRLLCLCALLIPLQCLAQGAAAPAAPVAPLTNAPRLVCEQSTFEFGELDESAVVEHEFVLRNAGTAPLNITSVRAACGCTVASLQDPIVQPGTQTVIKARLSLQARRGHQSKSIYVQSNDPLMPYLSLWMNGTVTVELALDPTFANFGSIAPDTNMTREVRLVSRRPGVTITNVTCDVPQFAVSVFGEPERKGQGFEIRTVPPLGSGQTRATVTVCTDHPERREQLRIAVVAFVAPEVRVLPQEIILLRSQPAPAARTIVLYPGTVRQYQVLKVENPFATAPHTIQQTAPGVYRIDITNLTPSDELQGKALRIFTDLPKMREIVVPIKVAD